MTAYSLSPAQQTVRLAGWIEGLLVALAVFVAWFAGVSWWPLAPSVAAGVRAVLVGLAATLPMLVLFVYIERTRWRPLVRFRRRVLRIIRVLFVGATPLQLAAVAILAGFAEELAFRGVVQPLAIDWLGPTLGILLASCLFGAAHAISLTYFVLASAIGVYLGLLAHQSGEILSAMTAHAAYDGAVLAWWLRGRR